MPDSYFSVLTTVGAELEAQAHAEGKAIVISKVAVGDGGGSEPTPSSSMTSLVNQVYEVEPDFLQQDDSDKTIFWVTATIPADAGGFWIREFGIYAHMDGEEEEVLLTYGTHAQYYKTTPSANQSTTHEIKSAIIMSNEAELILNVGESNYATQSQVTALTRIIEDLRNIQGGEPIVLSGALEAGASVEFPDGMSYVPGKHALLVAWNGLKLTEGEHFEEGEPGSDGRATSISLTFDCEADDEIDVVILGHSNQDAVITNELSA